MIGPLIGPADVAAAAEETLRLHLPATLHELEHATGLTLPEPVDYRQVPTADAILAVEQVTLAVACPGLAAEPRRSGAGVMSAPYTVVVTAFVRGADYAETTRLTSAYAVAIRTALLQHPTLGGLASSLEWTGEDVAPVGDARTARTLQLAAEEFVAAVDGVTDTRAGWLVPPDLSVPEHKHDPSLVRATHVELTPRTIEEE